MTSWHHRRKRYSAGVHPEPRQLSDYFDDELRVRESQAVEAHLRQCDACSAILAELRRVADLGFGLDEPSEPGRDLWPEIQSRLAPRPGGASSRSWGAWNWWTAGAHARAGIMVAAMLVLAVTVTLTWLTVRPHDGAITTEPAARQSEVTPAGASNTPYAETLAGLRREVHAKLTADPRLLDVIEENLATIDVAIANYRDALSRAPDDVVLASRIAAAEQRKLDVLRQAATLAPGASD